MIRARQRSQQTPIIFFTAMSETEAHVFRSYSLGAVDFIRTPVVPEILKAKVAVFVDLYKKTEQVKRQAEQVRLLQERRARSEQLAEAADRLDAETKRNRFFTLALDMLAIADFSGTLQAAEPELGARPSASRDDELTARPLLDFVHADDRASHRAAARALRAGSAHHLLREPLRLQGRRLPLAGLDGRPLRRGGPALHLRPRPHRAPAGGGGAGQAHPRADRARGRRGLRAPRRLPGRGRRRPHRLPRLRGDPRQARAPRRARARRLVRHRRPRRARTARAAWPWPTRDPKTGGHRGGAEALRRPPRTAARPEARALLPRTAGPARRGHARARGRAGPRTRATASCSSAWARAR